MCFSEKAESTANIHFSAPAPHLFFIPQPTAQTSRLIPKHPNGTNEKTKRHNLQKRGKTNTHAFTRRIILRPSVFYALTSGTYSENC